MSGLAPAGASDLAYCVGRVRHGLEADGEDSEKKQDLDGGSEGVPE